MFVVRMQAVAEKRHSLHCRELGKKPVLPAHSLELYSFHVSADRLIQTAHHAL